MNRILHYKQLLIIGINFLITFYYRPLHAQTIRFFPDTIFACKTDSIQLMLPSDILSKSVNIQWITPYSIIYHSSTLRIFQEGKYIVKLKTKQSEIIDSVIVLKSDLPKFELKDTTLCAGKTLFIPLKHKEYTFYTPDNKTKIEQLKITQAGRYSFNVSNKGCKITRYFEVKTIPPTIPEQKEYSFCINDDNKKINLKHNGISSVIWSNGSTQKSIVVENEDNYWVKISDKYCGTKIDTIHVKFKPCNCEVLIPNTFTPNDDGKNDYFYPILSCEYTYYNLTIYDKWNNIVFSSNNPNAKWDGKYKGNPLPEDVYVYVLETIEKNTGKKNTHKGKFSLIR